jgi:hypothetical protein
VRSVIAGVALVLSAVACVGQPATSPTPTRNATPAHSATPGVATQVDATTRTFCGHLVAFEQQVARDLGDGSGNVKAVTGTFLDHVSQGFGVLADEQNHLKGEVARAADNVIGQIGGVALWEPGDPEGFADEVLAMVDRIDAFEAAQCTPAA